MRKLILLLLLFIGCVGSTEPNNPLKRKGQQLWWQADTATITSNNPWERFVKKNNPNDLDPWRDYIAPPLFPKDWKAKKYESEVKLNHQILELKKEIRKLKKQLDKTNKPV